MKREDDISKKQLHPSDIELQLEDALNNEKKKRYIFNESPPGEPANMDDLRDPRFFMSKVDDDSMEDTQGRQQLSDSKPAPSIENFEVELKKAHN